MIFLLLIDGLIMIGFRGGEENKEGAEISQFESLKVLLVDRLFSDSDN